MTKLHDLVDPCDSLNASLWFAYGTTSSTGGRLRMVPQAGYSGIASHNFYDASSSSITAEVPSAPGARVGVSAIPLQLAVSTHLETRQLLYEIAAGFLISYYKDGASLITSTMDDYDPVAHRFLRIRESGGVVYWDVSADNVTWDPFDQWTRTFDVSSVRVDVATGIWDGGSATGHLEIDNINYVPPLSIDDNGLRFYSVRPGGTKAECDVSLVRLGGVKQRLANKTP